MLAGASAHFARTVTLDMGDRPRPLQGMIEAAVSAHSRAYEQARAIAFEKASLLNDTHCRYAYLDWGLKSYRSKSQSERRNRIIAFRVKGQKTTAQMPVESEANPEALAKDIFAQYESELVKRVRNLVTTILVPDKGMVGIDLEDVRSLFYRTGIAGYSHGYGDSSPAIECLDRTAVRKAI